MIPRKINSFKIGLKAKRKKSKKLNMNILYVLGGVILTLFGIWQTIVKARSISRGRKSILGSDIQLLGAGIMVIIIGFFLIFKYL